MKSKINIIELMCRYDMRNHNGKHTLGFIEGKYEFSYHGHDTGRDFRIYICSPDGDRMLVYDVTEWYSSRYYFNGFGKGYVKGPWVDEIEKMFVGFKRELYHKIQQIREKNKVEKAKQKENEELRLSKFCKLCEEER